MLRSRIIRYPRSFSNSAVSLHKEIEKPKEGEGVIINFVTRDGEKASVRANIGDSIMDITQANNIDLECACEGSLACSTCHVVVDPAYYDKLDEPTDEENDMLDLAFGLTETSRLGCQIVMREDLDGITVAIPSASRNVRLEEDPTKARDEYTKEINEAVDWAKSNQTALHKKLKDALQKFNNLNFEKRSDVFVSAGKAYWDGDMIKEELFEENINIILSNRVIIERLDILIPAIVDGGEYRALAIFRDALVELYRRPYAINAIRPIASGILDTSGTDSIWLSMLMMNDAVRCLSQPPEEYTPIEIHDAIAAVREESVDVKLQVNAAFILLENL
ncbi:7679_t:CDS:10 [Paraglomus brasilianum]|uniref:7679_t:CDS:1 n=1 Tax=Paraglomus brasilianum TaxID=144538 RepID=A0A9N9FER3_9GLOM|nr:7679_t:CDS:10 [Paraglomus brasilianum]